MYTVHLPVYRNTAKSINKILWGYIRYSEKVEGEL